LNLLFFAGLVSNKQKTLHDSLIGRGVTFSIPNGAEFAVFAVFEAFTTCLTFVWFFGVKLCQTFRFYCFYHSFSHLRHDLRTPLQCKDFLSGLTTIKASRVENWNLLKTSYRIPRVQRVPKEILFSSFYAKLVI